MHVVGVGEVTTLHGANRAMAIPALQIVRLESLNNSINKAGQFIQCWDNRLAVKSLFISKGYFETAVELLTYVDTLQHLSGETAYRQAVFDLSDPAICQ